MLGGKRRQAAEADQPMIGPGFDGVLAAAQAGAPWAFQRLFEDLSPVVNGYLRARGAEEPDDVASEAFLSVFRAINQFEGQEDDFRSWVFTIVHRRLIDERRKRGRRVSQTPMDEMHHDPSGGDSEREAVDALSAEWVREVLSTLNDDQRDVILLRVMADLSVEEVATIMDRRPGAVRTLQHRAIARLRTRLAGDVETLAGLVQAPANQPQDVGTGRASQAAGARPRETDAVAMRSRGRANRTAEAGASRSVVSSGTQASRRSSQP